MPERLKPKKKKAKPLKQAKYTIGYTPDGKAIRKSFYGRNNKEIEAKYRAYQQEKFEEDRKQEFITFKEFSEEWLDKFKRPSVSPVTYRSTYKANLKTLNTSIGDIPVIKLTTNDLQAIFGSVSDISKSKAQKMFIIAKAVLEHAVTINLITHNPMKGVVVGKTRKSEDKQAYTGEEYRRVVEFAKTHKYGNGPLLALMAGLRLGEICALQWSDIDFYKKILHVRKATTIDNHGRSIIKEPKTACSIRDIPINDEFCQFFGAQIQLDTFVIGNGSNIIMDSMNYIHRNFKYFKNDLQKKYPYIQNLNMHELRHSFGTVHYKAGTPIDVISTIMGHSNIEITKKIYVHDNVEDARNRIDFSKLP